MSAIFYPHKKDFLDIVQKYINFSQNEELWKELSNMSGLGMSILQEGIQEGMEKGMQEGRVHQLILNVSNLRKSMNLSLEDACWILKIEPGEYEKAKELVQ